MYGWGYDDTKTWKGGGSYKYDSAKKTYLDTLKAKADDADDRSYLKKIEPDMKLVDPKGKEISTDSEYPIIIAIDGTGSMASWPAEIFDRLPLLCQTLGQYQWDKENNKSKVEFSFSVIGDAKWDNWPIQVGNFAKDLDNEKYLKAFHAEGGGGPGIQESYELWAHFVNEHVKTPKATSPTLIIMGDESFYENISPDQVKKYLGGGLQKPKSAYEVWDALSQRFDIWHLRKPYPGKDEQIANQWKKAIGAQKVVPVYDSQRIVDIAMGIVAKKWGQVGDFEINLSARQNAEGIDTVMKSLRTVPDASVNNLESVLTNATPGEKSKKLTEVSE